MIQLGRANGNAGLSAKLAEQDGDERGTRGLREAEMGRRDTVLLDFSDREASRHSALISFSATTVYSTAEPGIYERSLD